jgi:hypothetical protein
MDFAVLEDAGGEVSARIERFDYDPASAAREVVGAGLPEEYGEKLLSAR